MKIFIAEKPDIARTLATFMWKDSSYTKQKGYMQKGDIIITWAYGHILGLANPEIYDAKYKYWSNYPIIPKEFKLKPLAASKEQLDIIKELLKKADTVIHAGDPDREGQLLIDEILQYLKFSGKVERILINAKDDTSLKRALDNIEDNAKYKNLYLSGLGRCQADWLVGMNLSRAYTVNARKYGYENTFRIGRVKIPTLALVVNREHEIKHFKPTKYYELQATFTKDNISFKATLQPSSKMPIDSENRIKDKAFLQAMKLKLHKAEITVKDVLTKAGKQSPPLPYSLDTLQVEANKKYNLSPTQVLETVQTLYERKMVSYPRSDCNYLPAAQKEDAEKIISMLREINSLGSNKADISLTSKAWNDKKVTAHHAIIPTTIKPEKLTDIEQKIYDMIALRYVVQFYAPCEFEKTAFQIAAANEIFVGSGTIIKKQGFKAIFKDESTALDNMTLPELDTGTKIDVGEYFILDKITKPPKRFTEGTLLSAMANIYKFVDNKNPNREKLKEVKGIGTPATRNNIIEELQATSIKGNDVEPCIRKIKNELAPTDFGTNLIESVDKSLTKPDTTAQMEYELAKIADGTKSLDSFIDEVIAMVYKNIQHAEKKEFPLPKGKEFVSCPICKSPILRKYSAKLNKHFHVCSNDNCVSPDTKRKIFYEDDNGKPLIINCIECSSILSRVIGKNGAFWICNHCKTTYAEKDGKPILKKREKTQIYDSVPCPVCTTGKIVRKHSEKLDKFFHICNNKDCNIDGRKIFYEDDNGKPVIQKCECGGILSKIHSKKGLCLICNSCKKFYPIKK